MHENPSPSSPTNGFRSSRSSRANIGLAALGEVRDNKEGLLPLKVVSMASRGIPLRWSVG